MFRKFISRPISLFAVPAALLLLAALFAFLTIPGALRAANPPTAERGQSPTQSNAHRNPVVVELFTSEGCSSCPPADRLLETLESQQPVDGARIIVLSEHVDYWNQLGWRDPFSAASFSEREHKYETAGHSDGVYTPQMIIDGGTGFVGSNRADALRAIAESAHATKRAIDIERLEGDNLRVRVRATAKVPPSEKLDVLLALTESALASSVSAGENSGHRLVHTGVVRSLKMIGEVNGNAAEFSLPLKLSAFWNRNHLNAIVYLQGQTSLRISGAAMESLAGDGNAVTTSARHGTR